MEQTPYEISIIVNLKQAAYEHYHKTRVTIRASECTKWVNRIKEEHNLVTKLHAEDASLVGALPRPHHEHMEFFFEVSQEHWQII